MQSVIEEDNAVGWLDESEDTTKAVSPRVNPLQQSVLPRGL